MGRLQRTGFVAQAGIALGTVALAASAGMAGPITSGRFSRLPVTGEISIGAFAPSGTGVESFVRTRSYTSDAVRASREGDIPWAIASVSDIQIPIATPDWRMMPRSPKSLSDRSARIQRSRITASISAMRGDEGVPAGSVFSTTYGDEPPAEASMSETHVDDEGNPVFAAPTKYFQDFEDGTVAREWRLAGLVDMEKFGRFAGPYRNSTQTLFVKCEPETPYVVTFDLLFIASMLGDESASDLFSVEVDGQPLLQDTFSVLKARNQEFNKDRDDFDADIYKQVAVTFTPRGDGVVTIKFKSAAHGTPGGETWGLDNVHIDIAPKQTLGELTHGDPSDFGALGAIGGLGLATNGGPFDTGDSYFRGDPSIRPPGPQGPITPTQTPVPAPGASVLLLASGLLAMQRRR